MSQRRVTYLGLVIFLSVAGCTSTLQRVPSGKPLPGYFKITSTAALASAVQWNQQYAVSAAHVPSLTQVVHRCSTGCDLVFIRRDAEGALPAWRPAVAGEVLEAVGQSPLLVTVKGIGNSKAQRVRLDAQGDRTLYALSDAPVVDGMSGGPVYGTDDAVVGMTVGIYLPRLPLPNQLVRSETLSVYVPYEIIQREWRIFNQALTAKQHSQSDAAGLDAALSRTPRGESTRRGLGHGLYANSAKQTSGARSEDLATATAQVAH